MPKVIIDLSHQPTVIIVALIAGLIPAILWLSFWLREDSENREPPAILVMTFIAGMLAVLLVIPFEKLISTFTTDTMTLVTLWSAAEEIIKFLAFAAIVGNSRYLDEPIEYPIYMITAALGFAALENAMFLMHPLSNSQTIVSALAGNLRFIGATLLHSVASGIVGIGMGLAFFSGRDVRFLYGSIGMIVAIALHALFNFFIIQRGENFLQVFGFLWVITIIIMLLFEKLRRMGRYVQQPIPSVQQ